MADTAFLVLVILSMLLNLLVYTPILSFWIYKTIKYRNSFVIKKRLPTLLIALISLSICYFSISFNMTLFTMGDILHNISKLILNKIIYYIFQIPFIYFLWFYALRFWLLYYKLEWSLSMMNNEWKSIVHHNNASDDWFIIHRQKYGSLRYLQKKLIIAVSIITTLVVLSWILYWEEIEPNGVFVWIMYIAFVFGPPTIVLFYVAWKLPHYDDYLALKDELKYSCYGFIIVICILILFFAIINSVKGLSSSPYLQLLLWHVAQLWNFTMITLHTYWVVKRFDPVLRRTRYSDASLFSDINKVVSNNNNNKITQHNTKKNNNNNGIHSHNKATYKLQQILKHPKSYDLFMHHLWKEHSSECLLSSTEFIQLQYLIMYHENTISIALNNDECEIDNNDLNQLHPDIPQSSIVFGNNPTNKISTYIINKLTGDNIPQITHKKSIFNASQKLAINQTITNITRNIATVISPSKSKHKLLYQQQLNEHTHSNSKPILAMSAPNRKRHSISGKLFLSKSHSKKDIIKSSNKKQQTHRRSLSGNNINKKQPLSLNPKSKSTPSEINNNNSNNNNNNNNANSAFQLQLEINTSDLLQGFEPRSPPISNDQFYKKPNKPSRPPPILPPNNKHTNNLNGGPLFEPMVSTSVDNISDDSGDNDSVVINKLDNTYSGIPLISGDTPTLKSQYIDPNEPPLPPLKPLPAPPSNDDININNINNNNNNNNNNIMDVDDIEMNIKEKNKKKHRHKRTLSLRDRLNGLVSGSSLRNSIYGHHKGHRRTQSSKINIFNDNDDNDDSIVTSDDEKEDSEPEDSIVIMYRNMSDDELNQKKIELIRNYREIAYFLWVKYVKVGAEYEINIDYNTRKRFQKLMGNKEEWLNNNTFNEKELSMLFNPCVQRMFTFLSNSFTRFRDKPDFERVQEFLLI